MEKKISIWFSHEAVFPHPGPSESSARLAPFSSESPACPGVGGPRSPSDSRGQRGGLRLQSGPGLAEGGELPHVIPEPWGGGGLPGQAEAGRPHPPARSRHLSGMGPHTTHRPRAHDGSLLALATPFRMTAQWRKGGRIRVGSSTSTPSAVRAWRRTGWRKERAEQDARSSCWSALAPTWPWHGHVARSVACRSGRRGSTRRRGAAEWTGDGSPPSAQPPAACPSGPSRTVFSISPGSLLHPDDRSDARPRPGSGNRGRPLACHPRQLPACAADRRAWSVRGGAALYASEEM
ncbi:MAG: hypothetical protein QOD62_54 [Actinomycetota bacterium]|nr:hypothetical protein [Actinomycetota bacterium]